MALHQEATLTCKGKVQWTGLAEVLWNTAQQQEQLAVCRQRALQEGQDRISIGQGSWHQSVTPEGEE